MKKNDRYRRVIRRLRKMKEESLKVKTTYIHDAMERTLEAIGIPDYFLPREETNMRAMFVAGFASAMKIMTNLPFDPEMQSAVCESISNEIQEWNRQQMGNMIDPKGRDMRFYSTDMPT